MKFKNRVKKTAVVAAAGSGSRMNSEQNKQFLMIGAYPLLAVTLLKLSFSDYIDEIIIAARECDIVTVMNLINEFGIKKISHIIPGGDTRQQSVFNALKEAEDDSLALIHDGARPFFSEDLLLELTKAALKYGAAAPGIKPKDTISQIDGEGFFVNAEERSSLRALQTPQVFKTSLIKSAHEKAKAEGLEFTDDCSLFAHYGGKVFITDGEENNIKITVPEDIPIAGMLMEEYGI